MSPLKRSNNIAARMGRWSASHWKTAVFGWLAFVVAAVAMGGQVGTKQIKLEDTNSGQSHKADQILKKGFPQSNPLTEIVLVQSSTQTVDDPAFRGTVIDVIQSAVNKVGERHPELYVGQAGAVSSSKALDKMFNDQLKLAGERSIPITIFVLLLVFGALVAVGLPLLLALTAVIATVFLVALPSQIVPMDQNVAAVILLIGLAVGVDYSLFYLKREREERAAGRSSRAAIEAAAATSGRLVLISGFTVMIAMAGLLLSGDKSYLGFGIATMMVVGIAMLGSLTVLPAMLSKLGYRVEKGRIPFLHRLRR